MKTLKTSQYQVMSHIHYTEIVYLYIFIISILNRPDLFKLM